MTIAVLFEIRPGTSLGTAANEAIALAQQLNLPVKTKLAGAEVYVLPTDTVQSLSQRYNDLLAAYQADQAALKARNERYRRR
jgi:hypothetical protein